MTKDNGKSIKFWNQNKDDIKRGIDEIIVEIIRTMIKEKEHKIN